MTDQDQPQNLPVEDESTADPVKLPETVEDASLDAVIADEDGLSANHPAKPAIVSSEACAKTEVGDDGGNGNSSPSTRPPKKPPTTHPPKPHTHPPELASALRSSESEGRDSGSSSPTQVKTNQSVDKQESIDESEVEEDDSDTDKYSVPANVFDTSIPGQWYVLHTYSGYEDAVADSLRQRIDSLDMKDKIFHVIVPKEKQIEIKNGKRKTVDKKIFPGYVLVKMLVTEASWYVVRNTPSVTGFIGSGTIPVPISDAEMETIKKRMVVEEPKHKIDLKMGDLVHITDGPFKEYDGTVSEVDEARGKIKVLVSIFGRETPVELDFLQVKRV